MRDLVTDPLPAAMTQAPSLEGPNRGYMPGWGNDFETEALPDALPQRMNSSQRVNCAPSADPHVISLGQNRWNPIEGTGANTWLTGMRTMTTAGNVHTQVGMAAHVNLVT